MASGMRNFGAYYERNVTAIRQWVCIAMKRLKALYELAHETDYDPDSDSEDESERSAGESDSNSQFEEAELPLSYFVVRTIPHHILSDQAAFNQFLKL